MLCEKFDARLHEVLDQRERPELDARLRDHALTCGDCAEKLAAQTMLFDCLRISPVPAPRSDFSDRVLATVKTRRRNAAWGKIVLSLVAIAAVLLVAVVPVWWLFHTGQNGNSGGIRSAHDGPSLAQDRPASDPEPRPAPHPATVVDSRGIEAPQSSDGQPGVRKSPDADPAPTALDESAVAVDSTPSSEEDSPEGLFRENILSWEIAANIPGVDRQRAESLQSVWNERVATPLKPVTSSVTGAVNVLRRTLAVEPALRRDNGDQKPQAGINDSVWIRDLA